jgi:hypothetical protein
MKSESWTETELCDFRAAMTVRPELPIHKARSEVAKLALEGIRVIDFTHLILLPVPFWLISVPR